LALRLTKAVELVQSMPNRSQSVRRALYPAMTKLFERIRASAGPTPDFEASQLKALLFGSDAEVEAIRLLRADTVVAVIKTASPALAAEMRSGIEAFKKDERSTAVQARLELANGATYASH